MMETDAKTNSESWRVVQANAGKSVTHSGAETAKISNRLRVAPLKQESDCICNNSGGTAVYNRPDV